MTLPSHADLGHVEGFLHGSARWYSVQGGREGVDPDIGALSRPTEEHDWWARWTHLTSGWIPTAHVVLYDSAIGMLSIRQVSGFDTSTELYANPRGPRGYRVVRRCPALTRSGSAQHYMFYHSDQGWLDIFTLAAAGDGAAWSRVRRFQGTELRGFADAAILAATDEVAHLLVLLDEHRTHLHVRTLADPATDIRRVALNARATFMLPGRFDAQPTGDDLLLQLPPNTAEAPSSHIFAVWGQQDRPGIRRLRNTTVGRSFLDLATLPLTVGGRSEIAGLDPRSGDVVIYDAGSDGRIALVRRHAGIAAGWRHVLYVPDLTRTDRDGQPGRSLLLYRPR
jgi:hypothetical protein